MAERDPLDELGAKAEAAMQKVATDVVERAKRTGTPAIIWQDGQIKRIPADEFILPNPPQHPDSPKQ